MNAKSIKLAAEEPLMIDIEKLNTEEKSGTKAKLMRPARQETHVGPMEEPKAMEQATEELEGIVSCMKNMLILMIHL